MQLDIIEIDVNHETSDAAMTCYGPKKKEAT